MAAENSPPQYPRPKSLFGMRAVAPHDAGEGDTCAYCGAAIAPSAQASQPGVCACGAHNSGVSARERRQQQMAG